MKIKSIQIKNYKSLRDISLNDIGDLVILIGPNSSGKSNFLEILNRFFMEIDIAGMPSTGIDAYLWFDGNPEKPIEISITLKLDEKECEELFPTELIKIVKEKFKEKYQEIFLCRQIVKDFGWRTKSIKWADIPLVNDGKYISVEELSKELSVALISLDDLLAVFFAPGASNTNITGDRLILVKSTKKAYLMSPYIEGLLRNGKINWVNVSNKITNFGKFVTEENYTLVNQELTQEQILPSWLKSDLISNIISKITNNLKGKFKLILAARNILPSNPLIRTSFIDSGTQNVLLKLSQSDNRIEQKRWSEIMKTFNKLTGYQLVPHPNYPRVMEEDLLLPIPYRGGGEQELLYFLSSLTEEWPILGIEEPELHMHPQLARQIFDLLKEYSSRKQIFITTHSTIFVDKSDISSTWIVRKKGKETIISRIEASEDLHLLLLELGVRPSDIFFSEAIIFVEGKTEEIVLPIWAEKIGVNLRSPKVSIIPTQGKNRGKYYLSVWIEACKATNIPFFMILDKDAEKDEEVKKFEKKGVLVPNENFFILNKGSIEDYYPENRLINAIESEFEIKLDEEKREKILKSPRTSSIEALLRENNKHIRGWKIMLGKAVAEKMDANEIEDEIKRIIERLRTKIQL